LNHFKNIILIGGTGRNSGKTTFACHLINAFKKHDVIGLKICPYLHNIEGTENLLLSNDKFKILRETNLDGKKDTSRMIVNGAKEVFYIQALDEGILTAFNFLIENFIGSRLVICESASLAKFIKPGLHFCLTSPNNNSNNEKVYKFDYDYLVINDKNNFKFDINSIDVVSNEWTIKSI
jgi:hypothetical protein